MLIAFHGKAGSGKDTAASILHRIYGHTNTSFADPLKRATMIKFGLSEWHVYTDEGKASFVEEYGTTVRDILQREGTEHVKPHWGEDFWVRRWVQTLEALGDRDVTVSDLRFEDEAEEVIYRGGYIVRIVRPDQQELGGTEAQHRSEQGIRDDLIDFELINNGTLEDLEHKLRHMVRDILEDEKDFA